MDDEFVERPLGDGFSFFHVAFGQDAMGVVLVHRLEDGSLCGTHSQRVELEDLEPLTIRSFACVFCGERGFVKDGKWHRTR